MNIKTIGILGGDIRMIYAGEEFEKDGYVVRYFGFDKIDDKYNDDISSVLECDCIILPVPSTKDKETIFMPLSSQKVYIQDLPKRLSEKPVFCCISKSLTNVNEDFGKLNLIDYYEAPGFAEENAIPTANATMAIIHTLISKPLVNVPVLIMGYGRIGKACAKACQADFCDVSVSVRSDKNDAEIKQAGYNKENSLNLMYPDKYEIIINTVPHMLLDRDTLSKLNPNALIIDLASDKGGTDFAFARQMNIQAILASGLPGKYYPEEAGKIIEKIIARLVEEGIG
ncbi:MAG: dipicolinate synthase subunit DpsA [Clostridia bacterium]|nr:dipicolinate synthase subunit DpsA [Clostridia bacterium]